MNCPKCKKKWKYKTFYKVIGRESCLLRIRMCSNKKCERFALIQNRQPDGTYKDSENAELFYQERLKLKKPKKETKY